MIYRILLCFFVVIKTTISGPGVLKLFPEQKQYSYVLKSNISSGTVTPAERASHWTLEAKLYAQVYNSSRVRYKLDDIKTTIFDREEAFTSNLPIDASILKKEWDVYYQASGVIGSIYVTENEPYWSGNIKRAISLILQIYQPENGNSISYSVQEPCLHGMCVVEYSSMDGKTIRKTNDIPTLEPGYGRYFWYSVPIDTCDGNELKSPFIGSAERIYEVDDVKGLVNVDLKSTLQYHTPSHIMAVNTELHLNLDKTNALQEEENLHLNFSYPAYYPHYYKQPLNGRVETNQSKLLDLTKQYLLKISRNIDENRLLENRKLVHNMDVIELSKIMSQLDYEHLNHLFQDLAVGTSYETETCRNIFLEMLPHLKGSASALFIQFLVVEQKQFIEDTALLSLIRKMPFNVANYSQDLLTKLEPFTILGLDFKREIRYACILSYATLAYYTYTNGGCSSDYFGNVVTKYFKMYSDYPSYNDRLIWLQGLSNLQIGSVYNYLAPKVTNSSTNRHERFLGLWATIPNAAADPALNSVLSWPILTDENEHIQLRIAALLQLIAAVQTPGHVLAIHNYIMNSNNNQLKKFWYSTGKSLDGNEYNCYPAAKYISRLSKQATKPDSADWATGNYLYDFTDHQNRGSACLQFMTIGEPLTGLPGFLYFYLRTTKDGMVVDDLGVMIKAEGVSSYFFMKLKSNISENTTFHDIVKLLKKLKVESVVTQKVHIDIIVKNHDKTIYATHLNHSSLNLWDETALQRAVQDFLQSGSHINQQMVSFPMQVELNLATELGTPVTLHNTMSSLSSIRGIISAAVTNGNVSLETDLTFRYRGTSLTSLSTIGPIVISEHTSSVQQSMVLQLPMKFKIDMSSLTRTIRMILNKTSTTFGLAIHSRASISIRKNDETHSYIVSVGETPEDEMRAFLNCEEVAMFREKILDAYEPLEQKIYIATTIFPKYVTFRNTMALIDVHPSGSCGILFEMPFIFDSTEITMSLKEKYDNLENLNLTIDYSMVIRHESKSLNQTGSIKIHSSGKKNFDLTIVLSLPELQIDYAVCINETDLASSSQDTSAHPSSFSGVLTLFCGPVTNGSCPADPKTLSTLKFQYDVENSGVYGAEGVKRNLKLNVAGVLPKLYIEHYWERAFETYWLPKPDSENFNFTLIIQEHNGIVSYSVNRGRAIHYISENVGKMLENWNSVQLLRKFDIYRECRLQESTVRTLLGNIDRLQSTHCQESLVLGECTRNPGFAVSRYKNESYTFHLGDNKILIDRPTAGTTFIKVDGRQIDYTNGYGAQNNQTRDFKISPTGEAVMIEAKNGIRLYYSPSDIVLLIPSPYMNVVCGECMAQHMYNDC